MAEIILNDFKISEDSYDSDVEKLINIIKPSWTSIQKRTLPSSNSSRIGHYYDANYPKDSIIIRICNYGDLISGNCVENPLELKMIQYLSTVGHFSKVFAIFSNGYCYQYIEGMYLLNPRERKGHIEDRILRPFASELAFIHSIKLEDVEYDDKNIFSFHNKFLKSINPDKVKLFGLNKNILQKEYDLVMNFIKNKKHETVICHGDPHLVNCVWNEEQEKLTFVDWEGVHIGYQLTEIGHLFYWIHMMEYIFFHNNAPKIMEDGFERRFVKSYVETWKKLKNEDSEVTEEEITQWMNDIEVFKLGPQIVFLMFGVIQPENFAKFSGVENMVEDYIVKGYLKQKEKILGKGSFETE